MHLCLWVLRTACHATSTGPLGMCIEKFWRGHIKFTSKGRSAFWLHSEISSEKPVMPLFWSASVCDRTHTLLFLLTAWFYVIDCNSTTSHWQMLQCDYKLQMLRKLTRSDHEVLLTCENNIISSRVCLHGGVNSQRSSVLSYSWTKPSANKWHCWHGGQNLCRKLKTVAQDVICRK